MSVATPSPWSADVPPWPIHRLNVAAYERMVSLGVLQEEDPVELLEGYLVSKIPKNPLHDSTIDLLQALLIKMICDGWFVRTQNALVTSDSVPEPDLAIIRGLPSMFRTRHPMGDDAGLVIEVADTSVRRDRKKAAIYAQAGIAEYWIINLEDWQLERLREPQLQGDYGSKTIYHVDEQVPLVLAGQNMGMIDLRELLTPPR